MNAEKIFKPIKESRGWYFVEYYPPSNKKFSSLNLIFPEDIAKREIINAMNKEMKLWLKRYPIPIFISAFDKKGDLINLDGLKPINHLIAFFDEKNNLCSYWRLLSNEEIPDIASNQVYIDNLFSDVAYKTDEEEKIESKKHRKQIKTGWVLVFIWLVIIPLLGAILEYYSDLLSVAVLIYAFYKALRKALELTNKWPKSKFDKEKELLKEHYYYHCQMNPEGFNKLLIENLEKESIKNISDEAKALKDTTSSLSNLKV